MKNRIKLIFKSHYVQFVLGAGTALTLLSWVSVHTKQKLFVSGGFPFKVVHKDHSGSRGPASVMDPSILLKREMLNSHKLEEKYFAKNTGPYHVDLKITSADQTIQTGIPFEVTAEFSSEQAADALAFEWILPEGVSMVSGATADLIDHLESDETTTRQVTLITTQESIRPLHLQLYKVVNGERQGFVGQLVLTPNEENSPGLVSTKNNSSFTSSGTDEKSTGEVSSKNDRRHPQIRPLPDKIFQ